MWYVRKYDWLARFGGAVPESVFTRAVAVAVFCMGGTMPFTFPLIMLLNEDFGMNPDFTAYIFIGAIIIKYAVLEYLRTKL